MGLFSKLEKFLTAEGCFPSFLLFILFIFCLFYRFPYGLLFGLGIYFLRIYLIRKQQLEKEKRYKESQKRYENKMREKWLNTPTWQRQGYSSKEEYLAEKERRLRKKEQNHLLAKSYKRRKNLLTLKRNLVSADNLLKLTPTEFEKWVKIHIFEKEGWHVTETKITGDGGIDLFLNRKDEHSIAQCKRYQKTVGEPPIRDFYGTMISEGVSRGYFVTTGLFSLPALKFAENKPIEMIDRRVLAQKYL